MLNNIVSTTQHLVISLNDWVSQALSGNSVIAGAVTASIVASIFYTVRKLPARVWNYVHRYLFFTYHLEYNAFDRKSMINSVAEKFEYELQKRVSKRRSSARLTARHRRIIETLADGGFFFFHQGACVYVSRKREDTKKTPAASEKPIANQAMITLSLSTFRFQRSQILSILSESAKEYTVPGIYQVVDSRWGGEPIKVIRARNFTALTPLAIDLTLKDRIDKAIDNFVANRVENNKKDKPHKLVFMFHGEPGTGKSALSEYIAFKLKTSLFCVNGNTSDGIRNHVNLTDIVAVARDNISDNEVPVILCDDFDAFWEGIRKRESKKKVGAEDQDEENQAIANSSAALGKLLTMLQSPVEITDCVVVFTTNHLEKIDPAVYRPGRVDVLLEVGRMTPRSVMEYFEMCYGLKWTEHVPIERAFRACDISSFYVVNRDNPQGFIQAVISDQAADDEMFLNKNINHVI